MKKYKYLVLLTLIYIVFVVLFWLFYSVTLNDPPRSSNALLWSKIYSCMSCLAFLAIGFFVSLITRKTKKGTTLYLRPVDENTLVVRFTHLFQLSGILVEQVFYRSLQPPRPEPCQCIMIRHRFALLLRQKSVKENPFGTSFTLFIAVFLRQPLTDFVHVSKYYFVVDLFTDIK